MKKRLRFLMASEFGFGATGAGLAHGLRGLGHLVSEVETRHHFPRANTFVPQLAFRLARSRSVQSYRRQIMEVAASGQYDVILTVKGNFFTSEMLLELKNLGIFCVNFYPDVSFEHEGTSLEFQRSFDLVATTKRYHIEHLKDRLGPEKVALVEHGYSSLVHRPINPIEDDADFEFDVSYVGNASTHKIAWISSIIKEVPSLRWLIAGNHWDGKIEHPDTSMLTLAGPLEGDLYAEAICVSRINLGIHYGPAGSEGWEDAVSTRSFEIPACGGFMLHVDNDEIRSLFDPGREIGVFSTPEEAVAKIRHYLDHADERMAIAKRGYARCVPAYSLDTRARELVAAITVRRG